MRVFRRGSPDDNPVFDVKRAGSPRRAIREAVEYTYKREERKMDEGTAGERDGGVSDSIEHDVLHCSTSSNEGPRFPRFPPLIRLIPPPLILF